MEAVNVVDSEDLYQVSILIDQLKNEDLQVRVSASKSIPRIARTLGAERTRNELIPFLTECVDDHDQVITIIAQQVGELCNLVGGSLYVHMLLPILEMLLCGEDNDLRSNGGKSMAKIIKLMADDDVMTHAVPCIMRLVHRDWFTARASASSLLHIAYPRVNDETKTEMFNSFITLCKDETPLVRRVAADNVVHWSEWASTIEMQNELIAILKICIVDEQDSIRIQAVSIGIKIANIIPDEMKIAEIFPALTDIAGDVSWRVRWSFAHKLADVVSVYIHVARAQLPTIVNNLLNDVEAEVRIAAATYITAICKNLERNVILETILPTLEKLSTDSSDGVRATVASEMSALTVVVGNEDTVTHVLPILLCLLRDENTTVRLNLINGLEFINKSISVEEISNAIVPAVIDLCTDTRWRVRVAVIECIPMIAKLFGVSFFNERMLTTCMSWLGDTVCAVRKAATDNLKELAMLFGEQWTLDHVFHRVSETFEDASFMKRLTALYTLQVLVQTKISVTTVAEIVMPILTLMLDDHVPNIRFTVAATAGCMKHLTDISYAPTRSELQRILKLLRDDDDRDVRRYAFAAQKELGFI